MMRLAIVFLLVGMTHFLQAKECAAPGIKPTECLPNNCQLPDCACEESEPDVELRERPQVNEKLPILLINA